MTSLTALRQISRPAALAGLLIALLCPGLALAARTPSGGFADQLGEKLYAAAEAGNLKKMDELIRFGADPNYRHPKAGYTPVLLRALGSGHAAAVSLLLSYKANPDAVDGRGTPILLGAATLVGEDMSRKRASRIVDAIQVLLEHEQGKANPNAADSAYVGDDRTALHVAAASGADRLVQILLKNGADPNKGNRHDETPLYFAAERGHAMIVYELLRAHARHNIPSRHTRITPLMAAAEGGHARVVKLLLYFPTDLKAKNTFGKTSLDLAKAKFYTASENKQQRKLSRVIRILEAAETAQKSPGSKPRAPHDRTQNRQAAQLQPALTLTAHSTGG